MLQKLLTPGMQGGSDRGLENAPFANMHIGPCFGPMPTTPNNVVCNP